MSTERSIPGLPPTIDGSPVARWTPWRRELVLSHIDPGCDTCADPGPRVMACGYAMEVVRGKGRELYRWHAHRCPACDEMRIYERRTDPETLRLTSVQVLYRPPRTHETHLEPTHDRVKEN